MSNFQFFNSRNDQLRLYKTQNSFDGFSLFSMLLFLVIPAVTIPGNSTSAEDSTCPQPAALSRLVRHQVTAGETLESIANQYNLIPATLMGLNPALQGGSAPVGTEILIPPYNGIRVEVPTGKTFRDVATSYGVRADVVHEVNGCQQDPRVVFVPGVNWSPGSSQQRNLASISGYPLPDVVSVALGYGWQLHPLSRQVAFHSGIDLLASAETPVLSAGEGTVAFAGERASYGNLVVVNHQAGGQTRYAHLGSLSVKTGQSVRTGTQLGTVGTTGNPDVQESHLHFEVRYNSNLGWVAEDPDPYLRAMKIVQK